MKSPVRWTLRGRRVSGISRGEVNKHKARADLAYKLEKGLF
jgi:hypothetical protein